MGENITTNSVARVPWLTLALVVFSLILSVLPGTEVALEYERIRVAAGEMWRLVTGQLVHWSPRMAFIDLGSILLLGAWAECRLSRKLLALTITMSLLLVALSIQLVAPSYTHYRGSSGIASGLFTADTLALLLRPARRLPRVLALAALGLLISKLGWEVISQRPVFAGQMAPGVQVAPIIHVAGVVAGGASFLLWQVVLRRRPSAPLSGGSART